MSLEDPSGSSEEWALRRQAHCEEWALGAAMLSPAAVTEVLHGASANDFANRNNRHIFQAIRRLHFASRSIDPVTVADELRGAGLLELVGGPAVLVSLQSNTPSIGHAALYAKTVRETADERRRAATARISAELAGATRKGPGPVPPFAPDLDLIEYIESPAVELSDDEWAWSFNIPSFLAGGLLAIFVGGVVAAILAAGA